jgi:hypothetical protein
MMITTKRNLRLGVRRGRLSVAGKNPSVTTGTDRTIKTSKNGGIAKENQIFTADAISTILRTLKMP